MNARTIVADLPDGGQVLVTIWAGMAGEGDDEDPVDVAYRAEKGDVWGPPLDTKEDA